MQYRWLTASLIAVSFGLAGGCGEPGERPAEEAEEGFEGFEDERPFPGAEETAPREEPPVGERTTPRRTPPPAATPPAESPREEARMLSVPAGTRFQVVLDEELSTEDNEVGDTFTMTTAQALTADGSVAVPQGATIRGIVTAVQHSEGANRPAVLKVHFQEIQADGRTYPLRATLEEANPEVRSRTSTAEGAAKVGGAAAAGAIIGRVIGGNARGTLIGAAVGAAAGTAIVLGTSDADAVLPEGSRMTLRLDEPLHVQARVMATR